MPEPTVPFHIAGQTVMVTPQMYERLTSPLGWGDLSIEELRGVGIHPGMHEPGKPARTSRRTPDPS